MNNIPVYLFTGFLEGGKTSLNDSMKLYEEGVTLVREANELLSKAKQKLIVVNGEEAQ